MAAPTIHTAADIPAGMREVTKEEFYRLLRAETRNVHPGSEKYHTEWKLVGTRSLWGWSSRGWLGPFDYQGPPPEVFAVTEGATS